MSLAMPTSHSATPTLHPNSSRSAGDSHSDEEPSLFSREELREFAADDAEAGRRIGKILSVLFIYTLVAMSIATWWTFRTVGN